MKYKKVLPLLSFTVFGIFMGKSQVMFNVGAGTNITIPLTKENDYHNNEYAIKPGFNISCLINGRSNPKVNFGMEVLYIENAYQDKSYYGGLGGSTTDTKYMLSHLNFSFFISSVPTRKLPISFFFGPTFGVPISQSIDGKVKNNETFLDFRATGKILVEFPIQKKVRFTIDNTFSYGLIQPKNADKIDERIFYSSLQIGLLFFIDKKEHL